MTDNFTSIIIPTWNSGIYLETCLSCLAKQTFRNFDIVIVDNGSNKYEEGKIPLEWPTLNIREVHLEKNMGFAVAYNLGAKVAQGEWLAFLNADAFPKPNWLERFTAAQKKYPQAGAFGSMILQDSHPNLIDSAGDINNISGIAWKGYGGYPKSEVPSQLRRIFAPCAAAAFYRRDVFLEIGSFDEDFFSYFEDVDFSYRAHLAGWQTIYLADIAVRHLGGGTTQSIHGKRLFYSLRSRVLYSAKHFGYPKACLVILGVLLMEFPVRIIRSLFRISFGDLKNTFYALGLFLVNMVKMVS